MKKTLKTSSSDLVVAPPKVPVRVPAGFCLVRRIEKRELRPISEIELPDDYTGCPNLGEILSLGDYNLLPRADITDPGLKPGDWIFFDAYHGRELILGGEVPIMVRIHYEDILGVVDR